MNVKCDGRRLLACWELLARIVVVGNEYRYVVDEREHDERARHGTHLGRDAVPRQEPAVVGLVAQDPAYRGLDVGEDASK